MRHDRLLRPHQDPWLHPSVYPRRAGRVPSAKEALAARAAHHAFSEAILTFGGDLGFHTECRLLRTRIGDWSYEFDSNETPLQSVLIDACELDAVCQLVRDLHATTPVD